MTSYEMSSLATAVGADERETSAPPPARSRERLLSLDIFRGLTLIAMTVVNMPGDHHYTSMCPPRTGQAGSLNSDVRGDPPGLETKG